MTNRHGLPYDFESEDEMSFDPATLERYDRVHNARGRGTPGGSDAQVDEAFCRETLLSLGHTMRGSAGGSYLESAAERILDAARHMLHRATEDMTGAELTMLFGRLPSGGALLAACLDTALVWEVG